MSTQNSMKCFDVVVYPAFVSFYETKTAIILMLHDVVRRVWLFICFLQWNALSATYKAFNGTKISDRAASLPSQHVSHFVILELGIWLHLGSRWVRINKFSWQKRCNFGIYFVLNNNLISTFFRFILIINTIDSE